MYTFTLLNGDPSVGSATQPATSRESVCGIVLLPVLLSIAASRLPIGDWLRRGFRAFAQQMSRYITAEAVVLGVESRTSSPVRIPRDRDTLQHPEMQGLYPVGEGAGYAGGIVSAALDGMRVAQVLATTLRD